MREKVLVESMIELRPFEKKKLQVAEASAKVKAAVSAVDIGVKPINSWAVLQKKLDTLIGSVKEKEKYDTNYGSGTNDSETHQENRVLQLIQLVNCPLTILSVFSTVVCVILRWTVLKRRKKLREVLS